MIANPETDADSLPVCVVGRGPGRMRLPAGCVEEFVRPGDSVPMATVGEARVIDLRGTLVPLLDAGPILGAGPLDLQGRMAVVLRAAPGAPRAAILFDEIDEVGHAAGDIAPLDLADLVARAGYPELAVASPVREDDAATDVDEPEAEQLLLVDVGPSRRCAVPLRDVRRVDEPAAADLATCGTGLVVRVGRRLLPVIPLLETRLGLGARQPILVVGDEDRPVALAVEQVRDIATADDAVPALRWDRQGIAEVRVVGDATVGVVDVAAVIARRAA